LRPGGEFGDGRTAIHQAAKKRTKIEAAGAVYAEKYVIHKSDSGNCDDADPGITGIE
jgi:hypothetical protein